MKSFSLIAASFIFALAVGAGDAEAAKRLGAGKSSGMQRQATVPDKAPTAAPTQASRADASPSAPAAAAQQAKPRPSWMGPVAGLAAGLGLAALASHFGFGEELASMLMLGLIAFAVVLAIGFFMRRRASATPPAAAGVGNLQYAGVEAGEAASSTRSFEMSLPGSGSGSGALPAAIPADFDVAGFVRNAKVNFIRLQAANDAGNMDDIRAFTTPEMFAELKLGFGESSAPQETDVVSIDADVLEVAEEASRYVASVRFTGLIREEKNGPAEPFDEIWHLVKPRQGNGGWMLAGIQQRQ